MPTEPTLENFTLYTYVVLWTITFLLLIRRGFVDRVSPYPATALLCAFPWNIVYFLNFHPPFALVDWIGVVYFCVGDSFMMYFLFRYSRDEYPHVPTGWFGPGFAFVFLANVGMQYLFMRELTALEPEGGRGYISAALFGMYTYYYIYAVSFILMLWRRKSVRGQSLYIAVGKMLGTGVSVPYVHMHYVFSPLVWFLGGMIFVTELTYAVLVYRQCRAEGIDPWWRF